MTGEAADGLVGVVGHLTDEADREGLLGLLERATERGTLLSGETSRENLPRLEALGLVVYAVRDPATAEEPLPPPALTAYRAILGSLPLPAPAAAPKPPDAEFGQTAFVRTESLPAAAWMRELKGIGGQLLERVDTDRYLVVVPVSRVDALARLASVRDVRLCRVDDTVDPANILSFDGRPHPGARTVPFEVLAHRPEDLPRIRAWLAGQGWAEEGVGRRKVRFRCRVGEPGLLELAARQDVAALDRFVRPEAFNDHGRRLIGLTDEGWGAGERGWGAPGRGQGAPAWRRIRPYGPPGAPQDPLHETPHEAPHGAPRQTPHAALDAPPLGLTGLGQLVGVADTGIDLDHPDLRDRVHAVALGRPGDVSDGDGHGTHVVGSLAGDGAASGGVHRGVAPRARVYFQSLADEAGRLTGLPADLGELLGAAYAAGVRVHNNSWGAKAASVYRLASSEIDEFVCAHPDFLVVVAAGNHGTAADPEHVPPGHVDLFSINAPATAKNTLTIGASRSTRRIAPVTWRQWSEADFPDPPIADEEISGDAESMAAFSSRGPCMEHERVKPDLVAPGTAVVSARAARVPASNTWWQPPEQYAMTCGTSMAAPFATGCAVLLREWFVRHGHLPGAALLKATLVNGARWLTGKDAQPKEGETPNPHQGFGMVDLRRSLPAPGPCGHRLLYHDTWGAERGPGALRRLGEHAELPLQHTGTGPLRLCLAWLDPPGRGIQHALGLELVHRDSRRRWYGNAERRASYRTLDTANNVQVIRLDAAPDGAYVLKVTAISELFHGPQHFAVVASGQVVEGTAHLWQGSRDD